jgi:hypothetical protein
MSHMRIDMKWLADYLLTRTWWTYRGEHPTGIESVLHTFNLFEGVAWIFFSGLVLRRYLMHRNSAIELVYAIAFFTFGLTDFREAYALQSWLIWLKAANLLILLRLRAIVIRRYYPESTLF